MAAVPLGYVDDAAAWSQNSISAVLPNHTVQLTSGANGDLGNLVYLGTPLGREGVLKFSLANGGGVSGSLFFGFVDAASSTSIATNLGAAATFYGFDTDTNRNSTLVRYAGASVATLAVVVPKDDTIRDYYVSYEIAAGQMTIKLSYQTPANVLLAFTGTAPSFTTMRPAIGTASGGSFANVGWAQGQPYQETDPVAYPVTGLTHFDFHQGADIFWARNLVATSYDWRVNGGSVTNVADSAAPTARISGLTDGTPATFEVRAVNSTGVGAWQPLTINPVNTYIYDDFNRADSTTSLGSPVNGSSTYTVVTGTWGILGGTAYTPVGAIPAKVTFPAAVDVDLSFRCPIVQNNVAGVMFRALDASNYFIFGFASVGCFLQRVVAGTPSTLFQVSNVVPVASDRCRVIAKGDRIWCYLNGMLRGVIRDDWYSSATTVCGMYFGTSTTNIRVDDLLVTDPPADPSFGLDGKTSHAPADTEFKTAAAVLPGGGWSYLGRDTKTADTGAS